MFDNESWKTQTSTDVKQNDTEHEKDTVLWGKFIHFIFKTEQHEIVEINLHWGICRPVRKCIKRRQGISFSPQPMTVEKRQTFHFFGI